jgi:hypothetical protein
MFDRWHRDDVALCACSCWLNIEDRDKAPLQDRTSIELYNSLHCIAVKPVRGLKKKRKGQNQNAVDSGIVMTGETGER